MLLKKIKKIPFRINYFFREFIRRNINMKVTYKFPGYSPHVGGKGKAFDKATEYNIRNLPTLLSEISTKNNPVKILNINDLEFEESFLVKIEKTFNKYGSDKIWHGKYEKIYAHIFHNLVRDPINILEIGIGSKNKKFLSHMGKNETTGGSLRSFKELFPNSKIIGADIDIDEKLSLQKENIDLYYVDQMNRSTVENLFNNFQFKFDLIIDDGLHLESSNLLIILFGLKKLEKNGVMVIEDIGQSALKTWTIVSNILGSRYSTYLIDRDGLGYCFLIQRLN